MEPGTPHEVYEAARATADPALYVAVWQTYAELAVKQGNNPQAARACATERMRGATMTTWEARR